MSTESTDEADESLDESAECYTVDRIGEQNTIPYFGVRARDGYLIGGGTLAAMAVAAIAGLSLGIFVVGGLAFTLGLYLFYVTPAHTPISTWLANIWHYIKQPDMTYSAAADAAAADRNSGGLANKLPAFRPDERTEELTGIRRAWVGDAAVLRKDGRLEGAIEIDAGNMDFAPWTEWRDLQATAQEYANKHIHSELKIHVTTSEFALDELTTRLEQRLDDNDVQSRSTLEALLKEYRQRRPQQMQHEGLQQHRIFLFVSVSPRETQESRAGESTPAEKTAQLPVIGRLFNSVSGAGFRGTESMSDLERHNEMVETVDQRLETIRNELVHGEPKWGAERVSTIELFQLEAKYWNGRRVDESAVDEALRKPAAATGREQVAADGGRTEGDS